MPLRQDLFVYTLNNIRGGGLALEASEALQEAVQRCQDTGKQATVTVVLTLKPNGATGQIHFTDKVTSKLPMLDKGTSIFFGTPDGNLTRDDPRQSAMDFVRPAADRPAEPRGAESA
jgi:hypothetical protein